MLLTRDYQARVSYVLNSATSVTDPSIIQAVRANSSESVLITSWRPSGDTLGFKKTQPVDCTADGCSLIVLQSIVVRQRIVVCSIAPGKDRIVSRSGFQCFNNLILIRFSVFFTYFTVSSTSFSRGSCDTIYESTICFFISIKLTSFSSHPVVAVICIFHFSARRGLLNTLHIGFKSFSLEEPLVPFLLSATQSQSQDQASNTP